MLVNGNMGLNFLVYYKRESIHAVIKTIAAQYILAPITKAIIKPAFKIANSDNLDPLSNKPTKEN